MDAFNKRRVLTDINQTVLHLVPKVKTPHTVGDFRPIACCTVVYKVISKLICNRIKPVLGKLINQAQGA